MLSRQGHTTPSRYGEAPSGRRQQTGDRPRPFPRQPPPYPPRTTRPTATRGEDREEGGRGRCDRSAQQRSAPSGGGGLGRGQGHHSSAVSTETQARAALTTQRGPTGGRKFLGGYGRKGERGPGAGGRDAARQRLHRGTSARSPPPAAPRPQPASGSPPLPRTAGTGRRRTPVLARGLGLVLGGFFQAGRPAGRSRMAPHLRSSLVASGQKHVPGAAGPWHARRAEAPGAGVRRAAGEPRQRPLVCTAGRRRARAGPPGSTRRAALGSTVCPSPARPAAAMSLPPGAAGSATPPHAGFACPSGRCPTESGAEPGA
ncbi:collagen alpha-2(I) chain-like [Pogoniulus pusillus]|uniref:collagen alpha-2(I) chain-like n=1 Tax=Pogoniulus pusillus TaxID=488313 RepID=UPI0030B935D0